MLDYAELIQEIADQREPQMPEEDYKNFLALWGNLCSCISIAGFGEICYMNGVFQGSRKKR